MIIVTLATYSCDVTRFSGSARDLSDKRAVLFSYGSGFASSMFSVRMSRDCGAGSSLQALVASVADLKQRLNSRRKISPEQFAQTMRLREETHHIGTCTSGIKRSDFIKPYQSHVACHMYKKTLFVLDFFLTYVEGILFVCI